MNNKYLKKSEDEDEDDEDFRSNGVLGYSVESMTFNSYRVHLNEAIKQPDYYSRFFDMCLRASEHDNIDLIVSSPGGTIAGMSYILEGLRLTDASTRAIIVGEASSAASMIALSCDSLVITDSSEMLCHSLRGGIGGKMADVVAYAQHNAKMSDTLVNTVYEGFLSPDEIREMQKGEEIYLCADEIRERLNKREEYFKAKEQALQEPPPVAPKRRTKAPKE